MATDTAYTRRGDGGGDVTRTPSVETPLAQAAPGMLRSRVVVLGALVAVPWLTQLIYVERSVRYMAGLLLLLHALSALYIRSAADRQRVRWVATTELVADACGCGVLLGAGSFSGVGVPLGAVVGVIAYDTGHWRAVVAALGCILLVAAFTQWRAPGTPLVLSPTPAFTTTLRVDPSFAAAPAVPGTTFMAPTTLDVDPSYAGSLLGSPQWLSFRTALRVDPSFDEVSTLSVSAQLFIPAVGLALLAICVGSGASAVWSHPGSGSSRSWGTR